jgi:tripartite ATP-independent transporter DctM subunit
MSVDVIIVLIGGLIFLLAMGLEMAIAIGVMAGIGLLIFVNQPLDQLAWTAWSSLNLFTLTAAPLFILMGSLLADTGVSERLFTGIEKWTSRLPGGLACSVITANALFGAMSGSTVAAVATFGKIAAPDMERRGYDPKLTLGSIAMGGILAPLIPPSILLILYGGWQNIPVTWLFAAALIPGLMVTLMLIITVVVMVKLNPSLAPPSFKVTWKERASALLQMLPFVGLVVMVLGIIFAGIMTPTEAAALGAFLALILTLAYKRLTFTILRQSLHSSVKVSSMAFFILAMATVLAHVFNSSGLTYSFTDYIIALPIGKYGILLLFLLMYLVMGMFFESWAMMFLTFPFVLPVLKTLDINLIWFGVVYVMAAEISLVTPPFGLNLFALRTVVPHHSIKTIVLGSLPFIIPILIGVFVVTAFPQIILWLPSLLYQ